MDFMANSDDPKKWQQAAEHLKTLATSRADAPDALRKVLNQISASGWPSSRNIYTFSQPDTEALIALCASKYMNWQSLLNAKSCFGTAEDVKKIHQAGRQYDFSFNLNEALYWSSRAVSFYPGLKSSGSLETTEQLFKLGADPAYSDNFYRAVEDCGVGMGKLFARFGLPEYMISNQMQNAKKNNKALQYRQFREIYWEYGRYKVVDQTTLAETKTIDEDGSGGRLKVIFNFAAGRVSEVYEWYNKTHQPVVRDFSFDDYGKTAVENARKKLIELGGNPPDNPWVLSGKKISISPLKPD